MKNYFINTMVNAIGILAFLLLYVFIGEAFSNQSKPFLTTASAAILGLAVFIAAAFLSDKDTPKSLNTILHIKILTWPPIGAFIIPIVISTYPVVVNSVGVVGGIWIIICNMAAISFIAKFFDTDAKLNTLKG